MVKKLRLPKDEQFGDVCCEFAEAPEVGQQPVQQDPSKNLPATWRRVSKGASKRGQGLMAPR